MNRLSPVGHRHYWVIREHCPAAGIIGTIVEIETVVPPHPVMFLRCLAPGCGAKYSYNESHALLVGKQAYHPFAWLKPIPPLEELERHEEEIHA